MNVETKSGPLSIKMTLSKVGTTAVTLPENVIDETAENNNIFMVENGEIIWNVKAIKEVLEPWLKNEMKDSNGNHVDNQFGRPIFSGSESTKNDKIREVIFINPSLEKLEFGYTFDRATGNVFAARHIRGWDELISSKNSITKEDFIKFLFSREERNLVSTISNINLEYTTHDEDYETAHKQEFETLTKNVFEKYHKEKTADEPDYNGAKVLFAFKTPMGPINLGYDGEGRSWGQYYLLEHNDEITLIEANGVRGLVSGLGALQNVLQNQEGKWKIGYGIQTIAQISRENIELFSEPLMTIGKETNLNKE